MRTECAGVGGVVGEEEVAGGEVSLLLLKLFGRGRVVLEPCGRGESPLSVAGAFWRLFLSQVGGVGSPLAHNQNKIGSTPIPAMGSHEGNY